MVSIEHEKLSVCQVMGNNWKGNIYMNVRSSHQLITLTSSGGGGLLMGSP